MIGRFDLYVIVRNQVSDRRLRRRALAMESVMEALAAGERLSLTRLALPPGALEQVREGLRA